MHSPSYDAANTFTPLPVSSTMHKTKSGATQCFLSRAPRRSHCGVRGLRILRPPPAPSPGASIHVTGPTSEEPSLTHQLWHTAQQLTQIPSRSHSDNPSSNMAKFSSRIFRSMVQQGDVAVLFPFAHVLPMDNRNVDGYTSRRSAIWHSACSPTQCTTLATVSAHSWTLATSANSHEYTMRPSVLPTATGATIGILITNLDSGDVLLACRWIVVQYRGALFKQRNTNLGCAREWHLAQGG